jgi:hypothetical protein
VGTRTARKRGRGVTRTLRIDPSVDEALRAWSAREGVSISSFANRALRKHVEWDLYADRFGFVSLPEDVLTRIAARMSQEEASELGRWIAENVGPAIQTFWFPKSSFQEIVHTLPRFLSRYARLFEFEEREDSTHIVQVFTHGWGRPTSALLEAFWRRLYADLMPFELEAEITDKAVILTYSKGEGRAIPRRARVVTVTEDVPA